MSIPGNTTPSLQTLEALGYFNAVSIVILIHDWFLTIEYELAFIWNPKWNLGTLLYLLTRYPAFVDTAILFYGGVVGYFGILSPPVHALLWDVSTWMTLFGIAVAEVIMIICVWAMWGRGRRMAIFLTIMILIFVGVYTMGLVILAKYISLPNTPSQSIVITASGGASIDFIALTLLEVILFFLVLSKAVQYRRNRSSRFVCKFFQHGLLYYVVLVGEHITGPGLITANVLLLVLSVANLAILFSHGPYDISLSIQRTFHAILSARMLLHLRRSAYQTSGVNTNSTSLVSEIVFQHGSSSTGDIPSYSLIQDRPKTSTDLGGEGPGGSDEWEGKRAETTFNSLANGRRRKAVSRLEYRSLLRHAEWQVGKAGWTYKWSSTSS
ncbi:hypothetical protein BD779DRAFT_1792266 [Infundibulicybe gibba]|nr:hypothetical protein BD779DRAFT_1792266 [Infundibulicybe gibba]